ncbi:MAG: radical SAM family heme chaperone HemW [Firmicutes bacterium]|nr:radical SAM family heme chaperone HemW [Bacillota bacterium]
MVRLPEGNIGIYVHVPYCMKKCRYCDFVSFEKAPEDEYFARLADDIRRGASAAAELIRSSGGMVSADGRPFADTVFFGGGTPSLASKEQLGLVLDAVRESFMLCDAGAGCGNGLHGRSFGPEITIEANPETLTEEKARELKALGFSRVSMGVQSLDDRVLRAMGRVHSADRAREAFRTLRAAGFDNINLDLIFGAPGQDLKIWQETLGEVISMRPEHISFYSLQLEEGTPLYKDYTEGRTDLPSWEENRQMYRCAADALKAAGYHHYEISNAALSGYECRHNLKYWNMQPYLGFGTSAHSFINGCRGEVCYPSEGSGQPPGEKARPLLPEKESVRDLKGDFIFTKLRLTDGFDAEEYRQMFGTDYFEDFGRALEELIEDGLLEKADAAASAGSVIRFTKKGLDHTNPVMQKLIEAI